ncbi:hypothetical protein RchiOBHm_Chr2g0100061 [Rosa chinensis]|uniref:Uncharacterized protein n=1 Tax=Rosa chinensis TaxID=74649 RepID=A0A2P6RM12_ROSCH|nr:hypothetical protein RchiOBHm_Chr2g0100061 [Rosa chinensis]
MSKNHFHAFPMPFGSGRLHNAKVRTDHNSALQLPKSAPKSSSLSLWKSRRDVKIIDHLIWPLVPPNPSPPTIAVHNYLQAHKCLGFLWV